MRTYVVRRMGRGTPGSAKFGDRLVRKFPAMGEMNEAAADELRGRGFVVTESTASIVPPPPPDPDYEAMTVDELRGLADDRGVELPSKIKKSEIIALLGG